ncbi:MAG: HoxN/HupN/NixA family nickel/cobalt transporter, partial [Thiohalocapsa sp.]
MPELPAATPSARARAALLCGGLFAVNIAAWIWAWMLFAGNPLLLGTAILAYSFGLRHAVDADHIAAIDNAARKLIDAGRSADATGLFFSLGHATVVVLASLGIALAASSLQAALAPLKPLAGALATGFSALCLFALALANSLILLSVVRLVLARRRGLPATGEPPGQRGLLGLLLRGLFRLVSRSWHLYPLGFLFGLGFDTATEIGVLGVAAAQASQGLSLAATLVFPTLFTAGMALIDTLDAVMMAGIYRWALGEPARKLYYNAAVTAGSVAVAAAVGSIELLGLIGGEGGMRSGFWRVVTGLNDHLGAVGFTIVALFAASWVTLAAQRTAVGPRAPLWIQSARMCAGRPRSVTTADPETEAGGGGGGGG